MTTEFQERELNAEETKQVYDKICELNLEPFDVYRDSKYSEQHYHLDGKDYRLIYDPDGDWFADIIYETNIDETNIVLDDEQWKSLQEILNRPPQDNPKLAKLLREPSVLESQGIDALIAEIDALRRHGDDDYIYGFDIDPILNKYRNTK